MILLDDVLPSVILTQCTGCSVNTQVESITLFPGTFLTYDF